MKKLFCSFLVLVAFCSLPMLASGYSIVWQDNGYGNDNNWYAMNAFTFVADTAGSFNSAPSVALTGWTGNIVNNGFSYATGPAIEYGNFTLSVFFADPPPAGTSQFEYYGYVNGTVVKEGIIMILSDGSWNYQQWAYADLSNAPQVPVPEPLTGLLLGFSALSLAITAKRFKKVK